MTTGESAKRRFHGLFRGTVVNPVDIEQRGRLQVLVPDVSPAPLATWALPCMPAGDLQYAIWALPLAGAHVWVLFEHGDPDYPVWMGGFMGQPGAVPTMARTLTPGVPGIVLQTALQHAIVINDTPGPTGGILLKSATGATITINELGITIQNGQGASIAMTGPTVTINQGAVVIT